MSRKPPIYFCPRARYAKPCLVKTFTDIVSIVSNQSEQCAIVRDQFFWACLHGGGGTQLGEVAYGGSLHLSYKRDQIKMRDYMDRRVTSPTWGPPSPCKQALSIRADPKGFRTGIGKFYLTITCHTRLI